jgi:type II secretory pathway predicted ATPase ExeA
MGAALNLKHSLRTAGVKQSALAKRLQMSSAALSLLVNHDVWPKRRDRQVLERDIETFLSQHGCFDQNVFTMEKAPPHGSGAVGDTDQLNEQHLSQEDEPMLLRKQILLPATKKAFGLFRDPFADLHEAEDMWLSPDIRYVREAMWQNVRHGGFLAVVGESGAGKSTLRRDLAERINVENEPVILVEPYVLGAEDNDIKGKTLKVSHIAESVLSAVAPLETVKRSSEMRFAQMHRALKDSHASGYRHCLIIEEAHSLPIPTLKHLKRILELEVGFTKLISVILIGQPELLQKLSERNAQVREVVQRCEVVTLASIEPGTLGEFLSFRLGRAGKKLEAVIDESGITALAQRLVLPGRAGRNEDVSQLYPLAIGNFMLAAMNLAAQLGVPVVNADIVGGV